MVMARLNSKLCPVKQGDCEGPDILLGLREFDERQRKMNSIVPECTGLKHEYDKCFNEWFSTKFLKGQTKLPGECDKLFKRYRECIKPKMENEIKIHEIMIDS